MNEPRLERRPALTYCAVPVVVTMASIGEKVADAYEEIERYLGSRGIEPTGPTMMRYRRVDMDGPFTVEVGWLIEEGQWIEAPYLADVLPEGIYLSTTHRGPYARLSDTTDDLLKWGDANAVDFALAATSESEVHEGPDEWACWYELYVTEPVGGDEGPEGTVEVCLLTSG